jgi:uncharacterized BrkB/YihY/UPF0761 family membrane protein
MHILVDLLAMVVLGLLSALLSYYNKNFYVKVFNDIWGRDEEESVAAKVGRGFFYGFLFPVYFSLIVFGLITLLIFLIVAGIVAAIVFILVWITDNILPLSLAGDVLLNIFEKFGLRKPVPPIPAAPPTPPTPQTPPSTEAK